MLHTRVLALPQQHSGGEGRGAEALLEARLMELGGSGVNGWLERRHCPTMLVLSASGNDRESSLQLSLKSLCRIVKTLSASQLVCSHLYQLPAQAPNFCLSIWVSILFVITFAAGVLRWTRDAGDGNTFPAASTAAGQSDPHAGRAHGHGGKCPFPSLGSAGHDTHKVDLLPEASQKLFCWWRGLAGGMLLCHMLASLSTTTTVFTRLEQPRQSLAKGPRASLLAQK